jgi:FKBP-type peptidyl-prolyl cis-trans isomerase SlyD
MMTEIAVEKDRMVVVQYRLSDEHGLELDSSDNGDPITYIHGHDQILPGLERELEGKVAGDSATIVVTAEDGFGVRHDELMVEVPSEHFDFEVNAGVVVEAQLPDGRSRHFQVAEVRESSVLLDGNHPLAGKTLQFDVTVVSVRDATAEELASADSENSVQ